MVNTCKYAVSQILYCNLIKEGGEMQRQKKNNAKKPEKGKKLEENGSLFALRIANHRRLFCCHFSFPGLFYFSLTLMFRASVRSFSDPLREHVCSSCLAQRSSGNSRLFHPFYSTTSTLHGQHAGEPAAGLPRPREPSVAIRPSSQVQILVPRSHSGSVLCTA